MQDGQWCHLGTKKFPRHYSDSRKSYYNEINILRILEKSNCPYIVKVLDYYKDNYNYYMVMEYAPFGDLDSFIEKSFKTNDFPCISHTF